MLRRSYDRLARWYHVCETFVFGRSLQRVRTWHLDELPEQLDAVLTVGEGDGRFLEALLRGRPVKQVRVVDASQGMLNRARKRVVFRKTLGGGARLSLEKQDARAMRIEPEHYDMVVTHCLLDCIPEEELPCVVERIAANLRPGGLWLISDFVPATADHPYPRRQRIWIWCLTRAFALTARHPIRYVPNWPALLPDWPVVAQKRHLGHLLESRLLQKPRAGEPLAEE